MTRAAFANVLLWAGGIALLGGVVLLCAIGAAIVRSI